MIASIEKPGTPEELVHFGVKGMKWGVRKQYESASRTVGRAGKKVEATTTSGAKKFREARTARKERRIKKAEGDVVKAQAAINEIQAKGRSINPYTRSVRANQVKQLTEYRDRRAQDAKDIQAGKLTKRQKQVLIGAGAAAVVLAAYGSYRFVETGTARQMLIKTPLKKNDLLSRKMAPDAIMKEVVRPINPDYGEIGTKVNCRRCTFAYEMRRRGNDVKATHAIKGLGQNVPGMMNATDPKAHFKTDRYSSMANVYKEYVSKESAKQKGITLPPGPFERASVEARGMGRRVFTSGIAGPFNRLSSDEKTSKIFDTLEIMPEGARGEISSDWLGGGRHSQAWEIIGGRAHVFDTQSGDHYTREVFKSEIAPRLNDAGYTRLDNIDLNESFLRRWITNA